MRLQTYISERKTKDANDIKRDIQAILRNPPGTEKDDMAETLMEEIDIIKGEFDKMVKGFKGKEMKDYDNAYEHTINAVGALSDDRGTVASVMKLYQKWVSVTTGIVNAKQKMNKRK